MMRADFVVFFAFVAMFAFSLGILAWLHGLLPAKLRERMDKWFA